MKYFIDTEFIEGFYKPLFGKRRHFVDLISIGIYCEDGRSYYAISNEFNFNDADKWVKENVIIPMYINSIHGDLRNSFNATNFHKHVGLSNERIIEEAAKFFGCSYQDGFWAAPIGIEVYGYYADYDWVVFCSLFGRMIDLPKGFPMYCKDLKQMLDDKVQRSAIDYYGKEILSRETEFEKKLELVKSSIDYPKQANEHNALADAKWDYELYKFLQTL